MFTHVQNPQRMKSFCNTYKHWTTMLYSWNNINYTSIFYKNIYNIKSQRWENQFVKEMGLGTIKEFGRGRNGNSPEGRREERPGCALGGRAPLQAVRRLRQTQCMHECFKFLLLCTCFNEWRRCLYLGQKWQYVAPYIYLFLFLEAVYIHWFLAFPSSKTAV